MRLYFILFIVVTGCISKYDSRILIINDSNSAFDSAVILVNNYKLNTKQIAPKGKVETVIPVRLVETNPHDVTIRAYLYSNSGKDSLSGMFYTDLAGWLSGKYIIHVSEKGKLRVSSEEY